MEYASAYETDTGKEMGRGKRKRKVRVITSSDNSDNEQLVNNTFQKKNCSIPSPPTIDVPEASISVDKNSGSSEKSREALLQKIIIERKKKAEEKNNTKLLNSKVLQSQDQFKSSTSTFGYYEKNSCTSGIMKSTEKSSSNNLRELYNNAKIEAKKKVKKSNNSTSFVGSLKTSSYISKHNVTSFLSEKETSIVSPLKESNISKECYDLSRSSQKSPVLNLDLEIEHNQMNSLSQSPVDISLSTQEKHSPSSSKGKLDVTAHNALNFLNASDFHEYFIKWEKKIDDISSKLDVVIMNQVNLNRSLLPEQAVISRPPNLSPLPLNNIKNLEEFEKFISKDVNLSSACYYLKSLALGNNEKTATSKLMSYLMTNSLATNFNFDGHNPQKAIKTKLSFKELKLWELFQGVMLLKFPSSDLSEALYTLRNWLRNAAGRKQD